MPDSSPQSNTKYWILGAVVLVAVIVVLVAVAGGGSGGGSPGY